MKQYKRLILLIFMIGVLSIFSSLLPATDENTTHLIEWEILLDKAFHVLKKGNIKEALQWTQKSYDYAIQHFGHQHAASLESLSTLASLHQFQDNYQQAEALYQQAISLSETIWGAKHTKTIKIRQRLASLYQGIQAAEQRAKQQAQMVVAQWNTLLQNSHQAYQQGQFEEALQWAQKSYDYAIQHFGNQSLGSLESLIALASIHHAKGHFTQAESMYKEALNLNETIKDAKPEVSIMLRNNLAGLYHNLGRYEEAKTAYEELLPLLKEIFGLKDWRTMGTMNSLGEVYQALGNLPQAEKFLTQARDLMETVPSSDNPEALLIIRNNLALLYKEQGRYEKAEQLFHKVLTQSIELLGSKHPKTLTVQTNLGGTYQNQGDYRKALTLYLEVLPVVEKILGSEHPTTLKVLNNLASIGLELGHYGDAEQIYQTLCPRQEKILGETHPSTLVCLSSLMTIYQLQKRYAKAITLSETVLSKLKKRYPKEPHIAVFFSRLASLYETLGRFEKAEDFYHEAAKLTEDIFGIRHPRSLTVASEMSLLYYKQSRFGNKDHAAEAEKLLLKILRLRTEVLGANHPDTLNSLANLAFIYQTQGQYQKARQLYDDLAIIQGMMEALGKQHPDTLYTQLSYIMLLIVMGENQQALQLLSQSEKNWLERAELQLYTTQKEQVRLRLFFSLASFQDVALNLALRESSAETRQFAGNMILHWKQVQAEEQAIIAQLVQTSKDEQVIKLAEEIMILRARLAHQIRLVNRELPSKRLMDLIHELEIKELALAKRSQYYSPRLQAAEVNLEQVRAKLPPNSALLEFRHYRPVHFEQGTTGEFRLLAMLLKAGTNKIIFKDLGTQTHIFNLLEKLRQTGADDDAAVLYRTLFGPFEADIKGVKTLYIAPDGFLNMIPFNRLILPDGCYWVEHKTQTLRQIQTGRDLLREKPTPSSDLLLAIGGVDFDEYPSQSMRYRSKETDEFRRLVDGLEYFSDRLLSSHAEVKEIAEIYPAYSQIWKGKKASEGRLKALTQVPRVLHFATHAFYLENPIRDVTVTRPLTLSGIALAGANNGLLFGELAPDKEDGILYSLEALGLNLNGTELVVFSACETGKGVVSYSEGVYGLVRAFKIAGAYRILMTLWPVKDKKSKDFMITFYKNWLNKYPQELTQALRMTQLHYINHPNEKLRDPKIWAAYVLVGP